MGKFETTMSIRGEVTVPFPVREALKLRPGDTVIFDQDEAGRVLLQAQPSLGRERAVTPSDLSSMPSIGLAARRRAVAHADGDPVGDYLVSEDERTKTRA
ncbi:hypothetical protein FV222_18155 [Methylobacterium sp. WL103]|uniref:hypothetical protein n=1 Tax=unclassified Methylobacterium TaxID=2615210 RepID=UPI0011C81922|nr:MULTISPECIES: hypothetical protein [unclassified Methylobacterium]TXM73075.1 hypothetical protein FV226_10320 [Methylobacterium sp. WL12]TXM96431.1 hypothetical protein FV222_18155 [Methylobacterium sp. WL103]